MTILTIYYFIGESVNGGGSHDSSILVATGLAFYSLLHHVTFSCISITKITSFIFENFIKITYF